MYIELFTSSHYSFFPGLFIAFTTNKKEPPAFGAAMTFWCILLPFLGLSFRHLPFNLSNYNVLTAHSPLCYQISGTWSNHEGSIFSWCWILSFYVFLLGSSKESVSKTTKGGPKHLETCVRGSSLFFSSFVSNFVKKHIEGSPQLGRILNYGTRRKPAIGCSGFPANFTLITISSITISSRWFFPTQVRSLTTSKPLCRQRFFNPTRLSEERSSQTTQVQLKKRVLKTTTVSFLPFFRTQPILQGGKELARLAYDESMRIRASNAFSIEEERLGGALFFFSLFFSTFLSASSDPFVRNLFLRTEPLAESNPVLQDPIPAIHPPLIYAGEIASAQGFALCGSKILHRIQALHSSECKDPSWSQRVELNGTLLRSAVCTYRPRRRWLQNTNRPLNLSKPTQVRLIKRVANAKKRMSSQASTGSSAKNTPLLNVSAGAFRSPAMLPTSKKSLPMMLRRPNQKPYDNDDYSYDQSSFLSFYFSRASSQYFAGAKAPKLLGSRLVYRAVRIPERGMQRSYAWTAGLFANTVISDQDLAPIRIWILTCRCFLTVGILLGSWWAHHELGRGGWWFRDPVENASFMPWVLATARIHSVILPLLNSWTSLLNIVTLPCCLLGTFAIRSGVLVSVHSFATDDARGLFLFWFFLSLTAISLSAFYHMKHQASLR
ncbi:hypothetical protein GIB67_013208 [Kingdonia uniflora]|uniref:Cytochrome c assembly protein domain-containing protein n=1 Tax=Kingdonia uniflora TaxID=39325 RepID=A0A7J7NK84_9MAGN|nr:hypothetical protein GIB67_038083 [Kingdonia uniflora]KAF6161903.1 hypothetical protein GIB67_000615 [Kingdonia uniflora]KAF6167362.1 hypothetical protein GIB67_030610 [Kingdonia uniflora]KAF6169508.1 hypothetical protein GIB67_013208 [Kingdonia uniflora]